MFCWKHTQTTTLVTMAKDSDDTDKKQLKPWLFEKGVSANPAGRPKGAKSKFSESFYQDMLLQWQEGGLECIEKVRKEDPATFLRVAASILPKDINVNNTQDIAFDRFIEGLENEHLHELVAGLQSLGRAPADDKGDREAGTTDKPNSVH